MKLPLIDRLNVPLAIFTVVMALVGFGLVSVYSASASMAGSERISLDRGKDITKTAPFRRNITRSRI